MDLRGIINFTTNGFIQLLANTWSLEIINAFSKKVFNEYDFQALQSSIQNDKLTFICQGLSSQKVSITHKSIYLEDAI